METPAGFRDFPPEEEERRRWLLGKIERIFRLYGFEPLATPAVEFLSVLTRKGGEEIREQIFSIEGEDIGLRFDLTVPLARFTAHHQEMPRPFKRYAIGRVWRNEEPQRGRYREFIQADADIVGTAHPSAEVELLKMAERIFRELGLERPTIYINDRRFLEALAQQWDVDDKAKAFRIIDKADKVGKEKVRDLLVEAFGEKGQEVWESVFSISDPLHYIGEYSREAYEALSYIAERVDVVVAPYLVRGLDYYTGPIFELRLGGMTVSAGGRYDGLTALYGGKAEPAVGISIGFERAYLLTKAPHRRKVVFVVPVKAFDYALEVAEELRDAGIEVSMGYEGRSARKHLEYADAKGFPVVVFVGPKEKEKGTILLKDMISSAQEEVKREGMVERVRELLRRENEEG